MILALREMSGTMKVLLFGVLAAHLATYMVVPLLPIYLKLAKHMSVTQIGLTLGLTPFAFQAGSLLGGWLSDRVGRRMIIAGGAWINAAALVGYALAEPAWLLMGMALLNGLGIGLNAPATKAAIAAIASDATLKTTAFSLRGIAANIGIATAGLLTFFVLGGASAYLFYTAAGCYALLGAVNGLLLPKGCGDAPCQSPELKAYKAVFTNKAFIGFSLVTVLVWALYTQLSLSLPLRAESILSDPGIVSLIWTMNSLIVISLQTTMTRLFIQGRHPATVLAAGVLFLGGGLASLYGSTSFYGLALSGAVFIVGEMLVLPTIDATVSRIAAAPMVGVFFGVSNFIAGVGESGGKFAGGQMLAFGTMTALPWLTYAVLAVVVSGLLYALRFWKPLQLALMPAAEPVTAERLSIPARNGHERMFKLPRWKKKTKSK
ncbi:MFS transporter [Xylanibacillus composti]|uniref:MFS transporter n=2 Tax=Xylanibacillus composti TaxID=1572762 RepID=A0A8J4H2R4_9BACL|nr:MFS transporter [Xylanibacillus composti]